MRNVIEQEMSSQPEVGRHPIEMATERVADGFLSSFDKLPDRVKETLGEEEQQMMRQIFDKDPLTFKHSAAVTEIIDKVWPEFSEEFERRGIKYRNMIDSGILHDVGKLALPDCILQGTFTRQQFADMFKGFSGEQPDRATSLLRNKGLLSEKRTVDDLSDETLQRLDYRDLVPLDFCFRDDPAAMAEIIQYRLDPHMTFFDALKIHESKSREIIGELHVPNKERVAAAAGSHHNYGARVKMDSSHSDLNNEALIDWTEVLRLSDMLDAMVGDRRYQKSLSVPEALEQINEFTRQGLFKKDIAERWVRAYTKRNL